MNKKKNNSWIYRIVRDFGSHYETIWAEKLIENIRLKDMKNLKLRMLVLFSTSILATLFAYRPVFQGRLLGDPFDARLQVILHEHWWRWFNGLTEFRNTEFFFPYKTALGYSDVFFTQGIIYSLFRFFNFFMQFWIKNKTSRRLDFTM